MAARTTRVLLVALLSLLVAACSRDSAEDRARKTAETIQKGMIDIEAVALDQQTDASVVSEVQRHLTALHEYQGEINGQLDSVTVNALQAFQRTAGLVDSGLITPETRAKLTAAAAPADTPPS